VQNSPPSPAVEAWQDHLRVVLVRPRNPLNIGAAARAMSNFGFRRLRLVSPWEPSFLRARSAVGAADLLREAERFPSLAEAVADCALVVGTTAADGRELQHPLRLLPSGGDALRGALHAAPAALLFGSEKTGLSNGELSYCHWLLRIPTTGGNLSMNLGQAVAVCLYALAASGTPCASGDLEASPASAAPAAQAASAGEIERLTGLLFESLRQSGYVKPGSESATLEKLRRMMHRMHLGGDDAGLWVGMMRHVLWKLTHPGGEP
jgi:TrmH family RNA methyltransferase